MESQTIGRAGRTFAVTGVALFMTQLDNLVVTTALPSIRDHLKASLGSLEWTVNAYTLSFAVFLLMGAALGDRFGRRLVFTVGVAVFTAASAAAALAPNVGVLIAARAVQGLGGALVVPLTLTLLSAATPPAKRGAMFGAWGAIAGLAVALGPLVGGAVVEGASWQWIFWINVPLGAALIPLSAFWLAESRGADSALDVVGTALVSAGLFGVVFGLVRGGTSGWTSAPVLAGFVAGGALVLAFLVWQTRAAAPMVPLGIFRGRAFSLTNVASLLMFFGMFGSIFLIAQYLQNVQGYSPLAAGVRTLPWTSVPIVVAPIAGALSDKFGGRQLVAGGLALQSVGLFWFASAATATSSYSALVPAFVVNGIGMGMFYAPVTNMVMSAVRRDQEGIASGVNNAVREFGGVLGIAVLAAVFAARGGYDTGTHFVNGLLPAVRIGAVAVGIGAVAAVLVPRGRALTAPAGAGEQATAGDGELATAGA